MNHGCRLLENKSHETAASAFVFLMLRKSLNDKLAIEVPAARWKSSHWQHES
jgi:hypothetical protein